MNQEFKQLTDQAVQACSPLTSQGYALTVKDADYNDDPSLCSWQAILKKGNVTLQMTVMGGGMSSLARYNTYTRARQECYFGESLFTHEDLLAAIQYDFPVDQVL
jgi:hypothetical protein